MTSSTRSASAVAGPRHDSCSTDRVRMLDRPSRGSGLRRSGWRDGPRLARARGAEAGGRAAEGRSCTCDRWNEGATAARSAVTGDALQVADGRCCCRGGIGSRGAPAGVLIEGARARFHGDVAHPGGPLDSPPVSAVAVDLAPALPFSADGTAPAARTASRALRRTAVTGGSRAVPE